MMAFTWNMEQNVWEFANGTKIVKLTSEEVSFIEHALERNAWETGIEAEIDANDDYIVFDEMSRDDLVEACMDELESKWECETLSTDPDYEEIVFDVANENGMWRE